MDILIGLVASFAAQGVKLLSAKFGNQVAGEIIFGGLFVVAIVVTLLQQQPSAWAFVVSVISFLGSAELTYQKIISKVSWLLPPPPNA